MENPYHSWSITMVWFLPYLLSLESTFCYFLCFLICCWVRFPGGLPARPRSHQWNVFAIRLNTTTTTKPTEQYHSCMHSSPVTFILLLYIFVIFFVSTIPHLLHIQIHRQDAECLSLRHGRNYKQPRSTWLFCFRCILLLL